ncbi:type VI secretion system Vgr family protein (plasmid) [Ralstonia solanacearum P673]|uniref:type VI secretion system Vgr family protein n=1 Tax=Ralstonia solanacearum TaxID=305 RepID=UPI000449E3A8|nr:contractile injection system protein, VgrG/Pvc8 family [Ralstonia solanacearum]EUJ12399.1 type VI secretion protein [Ralstonia solanacearum P673]MCL9851917.1 type VI secretion system tip protein VgrG [Ralstonia solanacearum]MCL9856696.1 type VI secretion system tip protein VgrG [Ralstonia solanacearum]MCL9859187.1 type VI secretion system tip protein VgrG [Ralstonia solanacearum]MCL9866412.1 type VI secretion system tip protein VgrG [Ralstonia solanacearum]
MDVTILLQNLFAPARRLYALEGEGPITELAVEAWLGREALSELSEWRVVAVSANARIVLDAFIGQRVTLVTTLAGGTQARRTGLIRQAEQLGADGSLARYRLTVVPWFWLTTQQRHSQVFQNRLLADIFEQVLSPYEPYASWRFAAGAEDRMAAFGTRRRLTQFRETDYHFATRLLAEAGLGFTTVEDDQAPSGHTLLIFADSSRLAEDTESAAGGGIRYHRAHSQEERDAIQQLICHSRVSIDGVAVSAWDAEAKRSVRGHAPARFGCGMGCPDPYLSISPSLAPDRANAQRIAEQAMESVEARCRLFIGRGTVRTLRSGTRLKVVGCPHLPQDVDGPYPLLMDLVEHCGINNLTADTQATLGQKLGGLEAALTFDTPPSPLESGPSPFGFTRQDEPTERLPPTGELLAAARAHGYAGQFRACDARRPWRAVVSHASTSRLYSAPTVKGVHSAIVVGPDGQTEAGGDGEHHTNPRGQIRVRLPWQQGERPDDRSTGWVPVAQRQAGAGMGWQWLPRIGQEVLLKCLEDDIDQMVVIGVLYNGQGEAGLAPTPGGRAAKGQIQGDRESLYRLGSDSASSAQANLAGGQSPAWHGMGTDPEGHRNAAALSGFKSAEHGGRGYSQLVFDDSDGQLRTQLATTQAYSQLNLGHLIHQQDNRRGSFRGQGFELRTDGYGAVRGQAGLLVTTYRDAVSGQAVPTGDNAAGIALIKQAKQLTASLSQGAVTHQTAALSTAKDDTAPLAKQEKAALGMVDGKALDTAKQDAVSGNTTTQGKVPHQGEAMAQLAGRAGLVAVAGQDLQFANGESLALASGQDTNVAVGQQARVHAGQGIGVAAGLSQAGDGNIGLQLTAGQDDIDVQAQHDALNLLSEQGLKLVSANLNVDFAAAKRIRLATAEGASITLENGNITVECPGPITYKAAQRTFEGPVNQSYPLPAFPDQRIEDVPVHFNVNMQDVPGPSGAAISLADWRIVKADGEFAALYSEDARGYTVGNHAAQRNGPLDGRLGRQLARGDEGDAALGSAPGQDRRADFGAGWCRRSSAAVRQAAARGISRLRRQRRLVGFADSADH